MSEWIEVPHKSTFSGNFEEWKKIRHLFPPSFYDVWVMNGKKKCKGYFDSPNQRWLCPSRAHDWNDIELHQVRSWKEIEDKTLKMQSDAARKDKKCKQI